MCLLKKEFTEAPIGSLGSITDTNADVDASYTGNVYRVLKAYFGLGWSYCGNDLEQQGTGLDRPSTMEIE